MKTQNVGHVAVRDITLSGKKSWEGKIDYV